MSDSQMADSHVERAEGMLKECERLLDRLQKIGSQESSQMQTDLLTIIAAATVAQTHLGLAGQYRST